MWYCQIHVEWIEDSSEGLSSLIHLLTSIKQYFWLGSRYRPQKQRVSKVGLKKLFEFESGDAVDQLVSGFILYSLLANDILEEEGCKRDFIWLIGSNCVKIILILLTKLIAGQMRVTQV